MNQGGLAKWSLGTVGTVMLVLGALCLPGCRASKPGVPAWIDRPPVEETYLYAIGSYVGSLYPEDNRKNALQDAIRNLSAQIKVRVVEQLTITGGGTSSTMQRRAQLVADNLVENSQVVEFWVDRQGLVRDALPGTVYCLVRAPMTNIDRLLR